MAIYPEEVYPTDTDLAVRVIGYARNLAPCLDELDGDNRVTAVAIMAAAAKTVAGRVAGLKAKAAGDWSWTFFSDAEMGSVFGADDRATFNRLCGVTATATRGPVCSFPDPPPAWRA